MTTPTPEAVMLAAADAVDLYVWARERGVDIAEPTFHRLPRSVFDAILGHNERAIGGRTGGYVKAWDMRTVDDLYIPVRFFTDDPPAGAPALRENRLVDAPEVDA